MISNYLRVALRTISRQKGYSFINVTGLAIGMASFVLIALFVRDELNVDAHLEFSDRLVQVQLDAAVGGQELRTASSPAVMAGAFIDAFPEVVGATRIDDKSRTLVAHGDIRFYEDDVVMADSTVFELFSIPMLQGDPRTALNRPGTVVIRNDIATKFFGDENPIGKTLVFDNDDEFEVTGVFGTLPNRSHFEPALIQSFLSKDDWDNPVWLDNSYQTYLLLAPGTRLETLEQKFPAYAREVLAEQVQQFLGQSLDEAFAAGFKYDWLLQRASDLYLHNLADDQVGRIGDIRHVYILSAIAMFILLIACINFMNLSTARAAGRAREVGLRKVMGSDRSALIRQFLGESLVMALVAMVLAVVLILVAMPWFNAVSGAGLHFAWWMVGVLLLVTLLTGLGSGLYPAFFLSGFQPAVVLRGTYKTGRKGASLRSALVVLQFSVSIALIVATLVVYKQLQFMKNQDLGFAKEQVVVLPIETRNALDSFPRLRDELLAHTAVIDAASSQILPGPDHVHNTTVFRGEEMDAGDFILAQHGPVSSDFVETLGLRIVAGRDFDADFPSDVENYVINESAAAEMGWTPEEAVGKRMAHIGANEDNSDRWGVILGVVQDAHFSSLHTKIIPLILSGRTDWFQRYLSVRITPDNVSGALTYLEEVWSAAEPGYPFRYFFMDEDYQQFYEQEERLGAIYRSFSILAVLIACLGLFGLASYVTLQRTREIGIRKALGATAPGIVMLLTREFTKLVVVSCALALPVAWFVMNDWLDGFAYRTDIGWVVLLVAGLAALLIAWMTVGYNSLKAAMLAPVRALRHD